MTRRLSRRAKAAIYLRADVEMRLAARRETQAERERQYRSRQSRSIHAAISRDVVIAALATLSACSAPIDDEADALHRAQVVAVCPDGTLIGEDPVTHRLLWSRWSEDGFVKAGLTPDKVCRQ